MYVVIKVGSKQYRVKKDDVIDVDLMEGEPGSHVEFKDVLFFHDGKAANVGSPLIENMVVQGEILSLVAGPKITSVKYIPGNHYKKFGHRQKYTRIRIKSIGKNREEKHGS